MIKVETWMERAVCAQTDPEVFFPERGGSVREAMTVCLSCPVMLECRLYALEHPSLEGIWGGTTPRGRQRLRGEARRQRRAS